MWREVEFEKVNGGNGKAKIGDSASASGSFLALG